MNGVIVSLILGTATPGGGFPVFGDAYAAALNAAEPTLRIETRNTKGSTENVPLLEAGKIDLGLVAGELAAAALAKPGTQLRIVAAMYSSPGMFVVKADSPVRSIADLKGKPVVLGTQGSGITVLGRIVLSALGIEHQEITLEKAADGPPMPLVSIATLIGSLIFADWSGTKPTSARPPTSTVRTGTVRVCPPRRTWSFTTAPGWTCPSSSCREASVGVGLPSTETTTSIGCRRHGACVSAISCETTTPVGLTTTS